MSDQEISAEKLNLWISKNVLTGGGKVFEFKDLLKRCSTDLNIPVSTFFEKALWVAMVKTGHPLYRDNSGKSFFYNISLKEKKPKREAPQKKG